MGCNIKMFKVVKRSLVTIVSEYIKKFYTNYKQITVSLTLSKTFLSKDRIISIQHFLLQMFVEHMFKDVMTKLDVWSQFK